MTPHEAFHATLTDLGPSAACSGRIAYRTLSLSGAGLTDAALSPLSRCRHVECLLLDHNDLSTLQPLSQLQHLTRLVASHNRLSEALDFQLQDSSNLRVADLSYNCISSLRGLAQHTRLRTLTLDSNTGICHLGGLAPLQHLRVLSVCDAGLRSCEGLSDLTALRELALTGNCISSLAPISGLSGLQVLSVAHNALTSLQGAQGLRALRRLAVSGNQLRRVEALAPHLAGLPLLAELDTDGNPLEAAQDARLYTVQLLTQLQRLNSLAVSTEERVAFQVEAGASLAAVRRRFFPGGELRDGGGAVPPKAAGLRASRGEEEQACSEAAAMLEAVSGWASSVSPELALRPSTASAAASGGAGTAVLASGGARLSLHSRTTSQTVSQAGSLGSCLSAELGSAGAPAPKRAPSRQQSAGGGAVAAAGGVGAIAARLVAGCCTEPPYRQLQLLKACHSWVLAHVRVPAGCSVEAGADAVTWDVGHSLFGGPPETAQLLQDVLLQDASSGTWAECVARLLVSLVQACALEGVQLHGWWRAGGAASVAPGDRLASPNHSWAAVKVNGRWRLLDPVAALVLAQRQDDALPLFLPPEAFIHTHLPLEAAWQLLPEPVAVHDWWSGLPELSLAFAATGGRLADGCSLAACNRLRVDRDAGVLPRLKLSLAVPASPHQTSRLCISLMDSNQRQVLAAWDDEAAAAAAAQAAATHPGTTSDAPPALVFAQQRLVGSGSETETEHVHDLWVAFPRTGSFVVRADQVVKVPGGLMSLAVAGLDAPLPLALRRMRQVLQVRVDVVDDDDAPSEEDTPSWTIAAMPRPQPGSPVPPPSPTAASCSSPGIQLLLPEPGDVLEADRWQRFQVAAPGAAAVAVGSDAAGWSELRPSSAHGDDGCSVFAGELLLPRAASCSVAVQCGLSSGQQQQSGSRLWTPLLALRVLPPVQDLVLVVEEPALPAPRDAPSPAAVAAAGELLRALDVDRDGAVSQGDMLRAFRRDRKLADQLRMPPRIRAGPTDSSCDRFWQRFQAINSSGSGRVSALELAWFLQR